MKIKKYDNKDILIGFVFVGLLISIVLGIVLFPHGTLVVAKWIGYIIGGIIGLYLLYKIMELILNFFGWTGEKIRDIF